MNSLRPVTDNSGVMHYVMHNFGDWEIETSYMTRVQKCIYLDMRTNYLKSGKPFTSDIELLAHRLSCRCDDERQALEIILKDKFKLDKRSQLYKHSGWDRILKNYRAKHWNDNAKNLNGTEVTTKKDNVEEHIPLTDAQRKAKSRSNEKELRRQLLNAEVDHKDVKGMNELKKLYAKHLGDIRLSSNDIATCHSESHAIVTQKEDITIKQKLENQNQEPFERDAHSQDYSVMCSDVQTDFVEQTATNHDLSTHSYAGIEKWQAPSKSVMQVDLSQASVKLEMTDNEYKLHVEDFKIYYAEKAQNGKPLESESIRKLRLRQWLQRVVESGSTKKLNKKQIDKRFNIDNESWEDKSSDSREVVNDVYHPSHTASSTPKVKANPKINVVLNGLWRSPLPDMSVDETYTYIGQHQMPGESQDETYDRLITQMLKEKRS